MNTVLFNCKPFSSIEGFFKQIRRLFKQYDVLAYFKPMNSLRPLLVSPKDKILKEPVIGPVYHLSCSSCVASYIGETKPSLKASYLEHR